MNLAEIIATGAAAEVVVRALAETIDADYQDHLDKASSATDSVAAAFHLSAATALATYRAVLVAAVDVWDSDDAQRIGAGTVPIRSNGV
jgi:fumarate hydratase class II